MTQHLILSIENAESIEKILKLVQLQDFKMLQLVDLAKVEKMAFALDSHIEYCREKYEEDV